MSAEAKKKKTRPERLTMKQIEERYVKRYGPLPMEISFRITAQEWVALDWVRKRAFSAGSTLGGMVRILTLLCLRHPDTLHNWLVALTSYADAEGVNQQDWLARNLEARPEYRRHRVLV